MKGEMLCEKIKVTFDLTLLESILLLERYINQDKLDELLTILNIKEEELNV